MSKKKIKLQDVQIAKFWNDTHELTLMFTPKETEPEELNTPTNLVLKLILPLLEIPTNLKAELWQSQQQ